MVETALKEYNLQGALSNNDAGLVNIGETPRQSDGRRLNRPTPNTTDQTSNKATRDAIDEIQNPQSHELSCSTTPIQPRCTDGTHKKFTPETAKLMAKLKKKIKEKDETTRNDVYAEVKAMIRLEQPLPLERPSKPSSSNPIDYNAFNNYGLHWKGGRNRAEYNSDKPEYNAKERADRAKQRAAKRIAKEILKVGDEDQITLALLGALTSPDIKPYYKRIIGAFSTEKLAVGEVAIEGMRFIADRIAKQGSDGGRTKECRALLQAIGMCITGVAAGKEVSKEAIIRNMFSTFPRSTAQRIMKKAGEKRKRFETEELTEFRMVEEDERRCKYSPEEIEELRAYMCDNFYTRNLPNAKDTLRERDINGKAIVFCGGLYSSLTSLVYSSQVT